MGPKFQQLAAGSHCKTLVRKHLSLSRRKLMQSLHGLQDIYVPVSVGVCLGVFGSVGF